MSKKPIVHLEPGGTIGPDGQFKFFEISFVANPPDPRARIFNRYCEECDTAFPTGQHPDNGCALRDVVNTMEE